MWRKIFSILSFFTVFILAKWEEQLIVPIRDHGTPLRKGDRIEVNVKTRDVSDSEWFINLQDGDCWQPQDYCPVYLQMYVHDYRNDKYVRFAKFDDGTKNRRTDDVFLRDDHFPFDKNSEYKIEFTVKFLDVEGIESDRKRNVLSYETNAIFDIHANEKYIGSFTYFKEDVLPVPLEVNHVFVGDNVAGISVYKFNGPQVPGMPIFTRNFIDYYKNHEHKF